MRNSQWARSPVEACGTSIAMSSLNFTTIKYGGGAVPQGVGTLCETLGFTLFLIFIGRLGAVDLAATSIACTLNLLCFLPMMGVGQAVEIELKRIRHETVANPR